MQEQNGKLSADFASLSEYKIRAIEGHEEEKRNCFKESEISQNKLLEEISKLKEDVVSLEEEQKKIETQMENEINSLSSQHESQLKLFENTKSQLNAELEATKQEKSVILEENILVANAMNALQLENNQVINDLQESQINQDICTKEKAKDSQNLLELNTKLFSLSEVMSKVEARNKAIAEKLLKEESEKVQESKKLQEMEIKFNALSQENSKLESECKDISDELAKMETKKEEK